MISGSDGRNAITEATLEELRKRGHEVRLVGLLADEDIAWPHVA
jgi:hypothetical protein